MLQLEVTPQITPDERIVMDLTVKQDTVGRIYHGVPSVNTTRITTQVLVEDGQTVVLGVHLADGSAPSNGPDAAASANSPSSVACSVAPWNATTSRSCSFS